MTEFKEIINDIAGSLNITVDNLVKTYPALKTEYIWYKTCENIELISSMFSALLMLVLLVSLSYDYIEEPETKHTKLIKYTTIALIFFVIIMIALMIIKPLIAPDIVIIKDIINTINSNK